MFHPERDRRARAFMLPALADEENLRLRFDVPTKTTATGQAGTRRPTCGSSGWSQKSSGRLILECCCRVAVKGREGPRA